MKIKNQILLLLFFLLITNELKSQNPTNATVKIVNAFRKDSNIFEFSLEMTRLQDKWLRWANATFSFVFNDSTFHYDSKILKIEPIEDPDLEISYGKFLINPLPTKTYSMDCTVFKDFMYVNILGPETFSDCMLVPSDKLPKTIATLRITRIDGLSLPENMTDTLGLKVLWKKPTDFYNAVAYKTDNPIDSVKVGDRYYTSDDNIDLTNPRDGIADYKNDTVKKPGFQIRFFRANYLGGTKVRLEWETFTETNCKGFKITRYSDFYSGLVAEDVVYNFKVGDYANAGTNKIDTTLKGQGNSVKLSSYTFNDTALVRNACYYYKLEYYDYAGNKYTPQKGFAKFVMPNSVIASALASPNPFQRQTLIEYDVNDDVYLSAIVFDLTGKEVKNLFKDQFTLKGTHRFDLNMPEFASQGLYDLRFFATPIKDKTVESSQASLRLTMYR